MLEVSERAKSLLKDLLPQSPEPGQLFRLARQGSGFALRFEEPVEDDVVFAYEDVTVLAVSAELARNMRGTIDREDSADGPRLVLVQ